MSWLESTLAIKKSIIARQGLLCRGASKIDVCSSVRPFVRTSAAFLDSFETGQMELPKAKRSKIGSKMVQKCDIDDLWSKSTRSGGTIGPDGRPCSAGLSSFKRKLYPCTIDSCRNHGSGVHHIASGTLWLKKNPQDEISITVFIIYRFLFLVCTFSRFGGHYKYYIIFLLVFVALNCRNRLETASKQFSSQMNFKKSEHQ